jgi:micrococcal nuclease
MVRLRITILTFVLIFLASNTGPAITQESRSANCDPAYPTVCIPSPPPDLDCPDISYRNFQVNSPDPHHFDGDKDGVGCEN